jgi:hypothetical protein
MKQVIDSAVGTGPPKPPRPDEKSDDQLMDSEKSGALYQANNNPNLIPGKFNPDVSSLRCSFLMGMMMMMSISKVDLFCALRW